MILYFDGHLKWANILECPYKHSVMFRSEVVVCMSIRPLISHDIELFIQTTDIHPPTPAKFYEDIKSCLYKNARGGLSFRSKLDFF